MRAIPVLRDFKRMEKLDKAINDVVDHITLADLVEEQKAMPDYNLM